MHDKVKSEKIKCEAQRDGKCPASPFMSNSQSKIISGREIKKTRGFILF